MVARPILDTQITIVITLATVPDAQLKSHGGFDMKRVEIVRDDLKRYFMLWNIDAQRDTRNYKQKIYKKTKGTNNEM